MRSPNPPKLATWLLEHFTFGSNEELTGDLVEEFAKRQSSSWYWRQVFAAICVGFTSQIRARWLSVVFAVAWNGTLLAVWLPIHRNSGYRALFARAVDQSWPQSMVYQLGLDFGIVVLAGWLGQTLYVALWRSFDIRRFTRGLGLSFLGTILFFISVLLIPDHIVAPSVRWLLGPIFGALWVFILLLSLWAAVPNVPRKRVSAV